MKSIVKTGEVYGFLTVLAPGIFKTAKGRLTQCVCVCGQYYAASAPDLVKGRVISCGCARNRKNERELMKCPHCHGDLFKFSSRLINNHRFEWSKQLDELCKRIETLEVDKSNLHERYKNLISKIRKRAKRPKEIPTPSEGEKIKFY
jgi:hypothetical protein